MKYIKSLFIIGTIAVSITSCTKDLDRVPFYDVTSATVYNDFSNYKPILAKLYAGLASGGQGGDNADIGGIDQNFGQYLRQYFNSQQLTTDETVMGWNDGTIKDLHSMTWTTSDAFVRAMYSRITFQVAASNEFIRETTDAKLAERGITGANLATVKNFRAEARFLRALSYWHALDMFGNVPFATENDELGGDLPKQTTRKALFTYLESELKAMETDLVDARKNEYGRADKAAAWTLLTKLYLNANVYIGEAKNTEAITYANKVIAAGYTLEPKYENLFLNDNHNSKEIIFPVVFDGLGTKTFGGMTFITHAAVGGKMDPKLFGINGGWAGIRTTKALVNKFSDISGNTDHRAMFFTNGQTLEINNIGEFTEGYAITKFKNVSSSGAAGKDAGGDFVDTDFPMFRLADVYLMYAEAVLRGGSGGDAATALQYVNLLRQRAYVNSDASVNTSGNITSANLNLDFILDERSRELQWECHRRTDLIRFNKLTGASYVWPWKGGVKEGKVVEATRSLFPIPAAELIANPTLKQNDGY